MTVDTAMVESTGRLVVKARSDFYPRMEDRAVTDWETRYYEQQALHTEARGMLGAERDRWIQRAQKAERELAEARNRITAAALGFEGMDALTRENAALREALRDVVDDVETNWMGHTLCVAEECSIQRARELLGSESPARGGEIPAELMQRIEDAPNPPKPGCTPQEPQLTREQLDGLSHDAVSRPPQQRGGGL
jgi:hypothetical protein